jgi:hypothetical protein
MICNLYHLMKYSYQINVYLKTSKTVKSRESRRISVGRIRVFQGRIRKASEPEWTNSGQDRTQQALSNGLFTYSSSLFYHRENPKILQENWRKPQKSPLDLPRKGTRVVQMWIHIVLDELYRFHGSSFQNNPLFLEKNAKHSEKRSDFCKIWTDSPTSFQQNQ